MPGFAVSDLERSIAWYRDRLGFEVTFTNGDPPVFALLARDGIEISLTSADPGRVGKGAIYLKLTGIDALYDRLVEAGVEMIHPLKDEPYQMRECLFSDPDGNAINLGQPIG